VTNPVGGKWESSTVNNSMERRVHMAPIAALPCRSPMINVSRSFWKLSGEMPWADFTRYSQLWRTTSCVLIAASLTPACADRIMHWDGIIWLYTAVWSLSKITAEVQISQHRL
jgi:hypothetical protein